MYTCMYTYKYFKKKCKYIYYIHIIYIYMVSPQDLPVCGFTGICSKLCTFELIFLVAVLGHVLVCSKLCTF